MLMTQTQIFRLIVKAHDKGAKGVPWSEFVEKENLGKYFPIKIKEEPYGEFEGKSFPLARAVHDASNSS